MLSYERIKIIIENRIVVFASILIFPFLLLLAFQGVDVCDEGWYMTSYQQIFNAPETIEYNFAFWLTTIVGGIWYEIFPNGGILSFRILGALCIISTAFFSYKFLKKHTSNVIAISGLAMVLIVNDYGYLAFYYNLFSGLLAVVIALLLARGLERKKMIFLVLAGGITAVNVFSRLPNATLFAFVLVFPIQKIWDKELSHMYWFKQSLCYGLGALLGFIIVFFMLFILGHLEIMRNAIDLIFNKGVNSDSNHNLSRLFSIYKYQYKEVIKLGIKITLIALPVVFAINYFKLKQFLSIVLLACMTIAYMFVFREEATFSLYFLALVGVMGIMVMPHFGVQIKRASFLAFVILFFLPLGSDGGIHNAGYVCVWLALPLFFKWCAELRQVKFNGKLSNVIYIFTKRGKGLNYFCMALILGFSITKLYNISNEAYFDKGSRLDKTYTVNSKLSKGIFTTKRRADIINETLLELNKHVKQDDYLLAYDNIPMFNYLTKTKPYMYISWVWVYDSETFKKQINRAESEIEIWPVVLQQKFRTIGYFSEPVSDYMSESKEETYIYKQGRTKAMNGFLKRNNYEIVWSNAYFNILKPKL